MKKLFGDKFFNDESSYQAKCHILTTISSILSKEIWGQNKKALTHYFYLMHLPDRALLNCT